MAQISPEVMRGEKWAYSGYILERNLTGAAEKLSVGGEGRREMQKRPKLLSSATVWCQ